MFSIFYHVLKRRVQINTSILLLFSNIDKIVSSQMHEWWKQRVNGELLQRIMRRLLVFFKQSGRQRFSNKFYSHNSQGKYMNAARIQWGRETEREWMG